jgi:hypothetical protein
MFPVGKLDEIEMTIPNHCFCGHFFSTRRVAALPQTSDECARRPFAN